MGWTLNDSANNSLWRQGQPDLRGVYAVQAQGGDVFIGLMETRGIAGAVVEAHNNEYVNR